MIKLLIDKEKQYITPTAKKYLNIAFDYAIKNNMQKVKVNRIVFEFDFLNNRVAIKSPLDTGRSFFNFLTV